MIALDAMGGDYAPREIVIGAINAAKRGVKVILFGDRQEIMAVLSSYQEWQALPIEIEHCTEAISMGAVPSTSIVRQKDASLVRALHAVDQGRAQAVVTAGNSGAALIGGTLILKRVAGIIRPALGEFLPTRHGNVFCLDLGANTDCKPHYLYQFALIGHAYVSLVQNIPFPRIALVSNGAESYKGSQAVKEAYVLLERSFLNFIGNIEPRDIFDIPVDVVVCDGFVGNIMLKAIQGTAKTMMHWIYDEVKRASWWQRLLFVANKYVFSKIRSKMDYKRIGASILLGVKHPLLVAHGCSDAQAIENALLRAHTLVQNKVIDRFNIRLIDAIERYQHMKHGVHNRCADSVHLQ